METLEADILNWYAEHYPSERAAIYSQIQHARTIERVFSSGGGAFIHFEVDKIATPISNKKLLSYSQIEGPFIKSPVLEHDASVGLGLDVQGYFEYVEIWAHAGDYPFNQHPEVYELTAPRVNYIDLR